MILCNKCEKEKPSSEFFKDKKRKSGFTRWCKLCMNIQNKKWKKSNCGQVKEYMKSYRNDNSEKISEQRKNYRNKNKDAIRKKEIEYRKNNLNKVRMWKKAYYRKCKNDPQFRIKTNLSNRVRKVLVGVNRSLRTLELLGCDLQTFMNYIEVQFTNGMSWENYGEWHIDHIKPCSHFDLTKIEEQRECFNYKNLQPLWASDNCSKQDRWVG